MKIAWIFFISFAFSPAGSLAADGSTVAIKVPSTDELFVCNASRTFNETDLENQGSVTVAAALENTSYDAGSPFRNRTTSKSLLKNDNFLAPLSQSWNLKISELTFSLSTERYGASYSVYFCYRGPVSAQAVDPKTGKLDPKSIDTTQGIYKAQASISSTIRDYADKADLRYSVELACDLRMAGSYTAARQNGENSPGGGLVETDYLGSWGSYSFSGTRQIETQVNTRNTDVPRFCMFKVTLTEKANAIRPNNLTPGEFNIDLDIFK